MKSMQVLNRIVDLDTRSVGMQDGEDVVATDVLYLLSLRHEGEPVAPLPSASKCFLTYGPLGRSADAVAPGASNSNGQASASSARRRLLDADITGAPVTTAAPERAVMPERDQDELLFGPLVFPEPGETELRLQLPPSEAAQPQTFQMQVAMVRIFKLLHVPPLQSTLTAGRCGYIFWQPCSFAPMTGPEANARNVTPAYRASPSKIEYEFIRQMCAMCRSGIVQQTSQSWEQARLSQLCRSSPQAMLAC